VAQDVFYIFHCRFHTTQGATTRSFRFFADITSSNQVAALYSVIFDAPLATNDETVVTPPDRATEVFQMTNDVPVEVAIRVRPKPDAPGDPLTFKGRIQSIDGSVPQVESQVFTVTATT
jgi:hypothetical protein